MKLKYDKFSISSMLIYYILFSILWLLFSDSLLAYFTKETINIETYQSYKNWSFIFITVVLLYILLKIHERSFDLNTKLKYDEKTEYKDTDKLISSIFQVLPDILFITKKDGTIIDYRAQKDSNLYVPKEVFLNKQMQEVLPNNLGELFHNKIEFLLKEKKLLIFNYKIELENKVRHYEARMALLSDNKNIMVIVRDITKEIHHKEELELQLSLHEQSLSATSVVDENKLFTYVNDAYIKMWGYDSESQIIGTSPNLFCVDSTLPDKIIQTIEDKGSYHSAFKAKKKDGTVFDVFMVAKIAFSKNKKYYITSIIDISKHLEQEAFIKAVSDTTPALMYVYDFEKKKNIYINKNVSNLLGYTLEELNELEKHYFHDLIHSADSKKLFEHNKKIRNAKKEDTYEIEYRMKTKDGKWLTLHGYERAFSYSEDNKVKQKIGVIIDVSDIRDKEQLLLYQSRLAAMGEMIDNIAYQWRQPLSIISMSATGTKMQKEMNMLDDKELIASLDTINQSSQYLSQTIEDFRNFFKNDKEEKEFYIQNSINKLLVILKARLQNVDVEIIQSIQNIKVTSIENELVQVLMNIVNNSIEVLETKSENSKYIFIDIYEEEESIIISIKDNAGGIADDIADKIFDARFTTKTKGTGVGLYMSLNIIKNLGGLIIQDNEKYEYQNKKYIGSKFTIKIPKKKK